MSKKKKIVEVLTGNVQDIGSSSNYEHAIEQGTKSYSIGAIVYKALEEFEGKEVKLTISIDVEEL